MILRLAGVEMITSAAVKPEPTTSNGASLEALGLGKAYSGRRDGRGGINFEKMPEARTRCLQVMLCEPT